MAAPAIVNLLLLDPRELLPDGTVTLRGARHQHARSVLRVQEGQRLRVGVRGGRCGTGLVVSETPDGLRLLLSLDSDPPPRPGVDLLMALPRPKALKRVLAAAASLGVDRLALINAAKVEKSYFDSKVLFDEHLQRHLEAGLEQARDTVAPVLSVHRRFKPFVEDELSAWAPESAARFVLHPSPRSLAPTLPLGGRLVLALGPEGGWVPFELQLLERSGFIPVSLGPRTLRVEVALSVALGALRPQLGTQGQPVGT